MADRTLTKLALISKRARQDSKFQFTSLAHLPGRRTSRKKFSKACKEMNDWLKWVRCRGSTKDWWPLLAAKLRGHYQYYGVSGNSRMISQFGYVTNCLLHKWLNRRSQKKSFNWKQWNAYLAHYPLPCPRIVHNLYKPLP